MSPADDNRRRKDRARIDSSEPTTTQCGGPLRGFLAPDFLGCDPSPLDMEHFAMACDLPFVSVNTLEKLIKERSLAKIATAYKNAHDQLPEPLCTIWEAQSYPLILKFVKQGTRCPRKILINSDTQLLEPLHKNALDNINSPEEYKQALRSIGK